MILKTIHYCWFGRGEMPELAIKCIALWHKYMPDYEYKLWNEINMEYFSPRHTTGEYIRTENTFCDHLGLGSWDDREPGWKTKIAEFVGQKNTVRLIKLKRKLFG